MGLAGLPVFSDRLPGFITLAGPTGGYIVGFVLSAFVAGWIFENAKPKSFVGTFIALFVASLFIFIPGVLWLKTLTQTSLAQALALGFTPFLIGDLVKTLAATIAVRLRR
jgi:biotin transport system substrate-specific component